MKCLQSASPRVYLFSIGIFALLVVAFAVAKNSDVKAGFKMLGIELTIETTDRPQNVHPIEHAGTALQGAPAQIKRATAALSLASSAPSSTLDRQLETGQ